MSQTDDSESFVFHCPHCKEAINFSVEAYVSPVDQYDDYEEWEEDEREEDDRAWITYYDSMGKMELAIRNNLREMFVIDAIMENMQDLKDAIGDATEPSSLYFPVLDRGAKVLALKGYRQGLEKMSDVVTNSVGLQSHATEVEKHFSDMQLFQDIREAVRANPKCDQSDVKILVAEVDGRRVANLIQWLDRHGDIIRTREGRKIFLEIA